MEKYSFQTHAVIRPLNLMFFRIPATQVLCAARVSAAVIQRELHISHIHSNRYLYFCYLSSARPNLRDYFLIGHSVQFCFCLLLSPFVGVYWYAIYICIFVERGYCLLILMDLNKFILIAPLPELGTWGSFWPPTSFPCLSLINSWASSKTRTGSI